MDQIIDCYRFPSPNPRVRLSMVTYWSDGLKVKGMLAEPKEEGTYDGFLYLRGGIKNVGMVRPARIAQFASEGFIVFAPFYRGNRGGEGNEDFAGEDRMDAFAAFDLLMSHPRVNHHVHIFGFSRGGVMALLTALERNPASIVTWGGVSDMVLTYEERKDLRRMMKRVIGASPYKDEEVYRWRTPLYELDKIDAPVLIIHGMHDQNVSPEHAFRLERRLQELEKTVETWYFKEYNHYFPPRVNRRIVTDVGRWMKKHRE
ncbi:alpha/beta hydrolase family protein [Bacillus thermotolerans]|uniref:Dipeptidyl aminopeptidase n=1 Tax=Bacillus thermotolerans TaxID=1221996 RepID=A0A0F5HW71_BACTR|nr:prolyl oligopeptidase family serine peptidase [Bacillus thermotolerans]KKB37521.1 Dipeptidyl aminopeptidase [Bacillus thermotolerans]KKB39725.1 Dipeptidyl aminopeptidase [Bacillus thermotolerans]KKB43612.1 Dipeptidyl aminopeptidase [Bacillus thermotolerans]